MDPFRRILFPFLLVVAGAPAVAGDGPLLPARQDVADTSQSHWSRRWWQWAASFDRDDSPVADRTGALCAAGQQGSVWFLAGTYGSQRVLRECSVPAGKYLFFPLVNYLVNATEDQAPSCDAVIREARRLTDGVSHLVLSIDGKPQPGLELHRVDTLGCFDLGARMSPRVSIFPAAGNGYYAMLKPLPPGTHELEFGGWLPDMSQAVSYTIHVR